MKIRIDFEAWNEHSPYRLTLIRKIGDRTEENWLESKRSEQEARDYAERYIAGPLFVAEYEK